MKRLIVIGTLLAILLVALLPMPTFAGCNAHNWTPTNTCPIPCACIGYCENITQWYKVSYSAPVFLYFEQWGFGYWTSVWTTEYVETRTSDDAATQLGLNAGYDCFVNRALGYTG